MRRLIPGLLLIAALAGFSLPVSVSYADVPQHTSITALPTGTGKIDTRYRDGDDAGATPPTAPLLLGATAVSSSAIDIVQSIPAEDGTPPLTILIERTTTAPSGFIEIDSGTALFATDSTYRSTGLTDDTEFCFRTKVRDADLRESAYSNTVCATTPAAVADGTAPTTPGNPTLTAVTAVGATFSWTASTDAVGVTGYQVGRGLATGSCSSVAGTWVWLNQNIAPGTTSYVDASGIAGQQYYYRVSAYDAASNTSAASTSVCITTLTPASPANLYQYYDYEGSSIPSVWVEPDRNVTSPTISTEHARMGSKSVKFTLSQSGYDPPDGDRQELAHTDPKFNGSTADFPYGQNICYAFSIYFPSDWVTEALGQIFHQWHNYPLTPPENGNPPFALRQTNGASTLEIGNCRMLASAQDKTCRTIPIGALPKGKWLDLQIRYKPHWNAAQAGLTVRRRVPVDEADYTQVHHDEGTVPNIYERTSTTGTSSELKKGKYKWAIGSTYSPKASTSVIYIDEWRMGQLNQTSCNWDELTPTGTGN